jgi:hypothetical protein
MKHPLIPLLDALRTCEVPHDFDGETVSFYNVRVSAQASDPLRLPHVAGRIGIQVSLTDGDAAYCYIEVDPESIAQFALSRAISDDPRLEEARTFQKRWSEV